MLVLLSWIGFIMLSYYIQVVMNSQTHNFRIKATTNHLNCVGLTAVGTQFKLTLCSKYRNKAVTHEADGVRLAADWLHSPTHRPLITNTK